MTDRALPLKFRDGLFPCLLVALKRRWFESRQLDTGGGGEEHNNICERQFLSHTR